MDQVIQLQQQIQRLQQEINDITSVCSQLQQSEQANAIQLQQMTHKEMLATQGLRRIQQVASQLSQDINQISSITQQMATQVPLHRAVQTTGVFPGTYTTYAGLSSQNPGTGVFSSQNQPGAFGQSNIPNISMGPSVTQLPLYTQGYSPNLFGSGNQLGTGSQAFSNNANQFGLGTQAFSNAAPNQFGMGIQGNLASSLYNPMQTTSMGMAAPGMQTQSNLGTLSAGYSPYQSNQFGFR